MFVKTLKLLTAASVAAFFMSCSSSSHSSSAPDDEDSSLSSSSSADLDEILDGKSSSSKGEASNKKSSSSNKPSSKDDDDDELSGKSSASKDDDDDELSGKSSASKDDDDDEPSGKSSSSKGDVSDKSSSSNKPGDSAPVEVVLKTSCDAEMSETEREALDLTNAEAYEMFAALSGNDFSEVKALSAQVKPKYAKILKKFPKSCGAQFGYAVSSLVDLHNNKAVSTYVESLFNAVDGASAFDGQARVAKILNLLTQNLDYDISEYTQSVIVKRALPALDTAITFVKNVSANEDFSIRFKADGDLHEMDLSEFGIVLGASYAAKAMFTMLASMDLSMADKDGSYDWIAKDPIPDLDRLQAVGVTLLKALCKKSTFSTVKAAWVTKWKSVPDLLDSALKFTYDGFKYSVNESMEDGSQDYDIIVVGDGADADISVGDVQNAMTLIKEVRDEVLDGNYSLDFSRFDKKSDFKVVINLRKFFSITDGFGDFLPYHKMEGSDLSTFTFTNKAGKPTASLDIFLEGRLSEGKVENLYFPDPTFGGVFPKFKSDDDVRTFLVTLSKL